MNDLVLLVPEEVDEGVGHHSAPVDDVGGYMEGRVVVALIHKLKQLRGIGCTLETEINLK